MKPIRTCARCEHLRTQRLSRGMCVVSCRLTGYVVPHAYDGANDPDRVTLWRVPHECPRPEPEVKTREKPLPQAEWEFIDLGPYRGPDSLDDNTKKGAE